MANKGNGGISKPTRTGTGITYTEKEGAATAPPRRTLHPPKKDTGKIGG